MGGAKAWLGPSGRGAAGSSERCHPGLVPDGREALPQASA